MRAAVSRCKKIPGTKTAAEQPGPPPGPFVLFPSWKVSRYSRRGITYKPPTRHKSYRQPSPNKAAQAMTSPRCSPVGKERGHESTVEKRSHPAPTRQFPESSFGAAAFVAAAAGMAGSPVISHLAKGGRFSGELLTGRDSRHLRGCGQ